jgi:hypothetical protein
MAGVNNNGAHSANGITPLFRRQRGRGVVRAHDLYGRNR